MKNITIAGNVGKPAEIRTTQSGTSVTSCSIAVSGYANGEKTTTWFDVSMFGKRGEALAQFATKGAKMTVTGDLSTREYEGKTYLQVRADNFTPQGGGQDRQQSGGYDQTPQGDGYGAGGRPDIDADDIPFAPVTLI
jgi:single-strand DNA-binding protein